MSLVFMLNLYAMLIQELYKFKNTTMEKLFLQVTYRELLLERRSCVFFIN